MAEKTDKRYYFIKLPMDFFSDKVIKALKSKPNGDTYVVIALKLLLFGLSMDNVLQFDGLEPTFAEELAVSIDENPEDVATVMDILLKAKWFVQESDTVIQSVKGEELTEAIAESTLRVRKLRSLRKQKELASSYQDISEQFPEENDEERYIDVSSPLHERFNSVSSRSYSGNGETDAKRIGNTEIDIRDRDRERDRARDRDITVLSSEKKQSKEKLDLSEDLSDPDVSGNAEPCQCPPAKSTRFVKPSLKEVEAYCRERRNSVSAEAFMAFYDSNGWKVGRNPMKDWKAAVRTWEQRERADGRSARKEQIDPQYLNDEFKTDVLEASDGRWH